MSTRALEIGLTGIFGAGCDLTAIMTLISNFCAEAEMEPSLREPPQHTSFTKKRVVIRLLLFCFALCSLLYNIGMAFNKKDTTLCYTAHVFGLWFQSVGFVVFGTMWVDELSRMLSEDSSATIRYDWISCVGGMVVLLYTAFAVLLIVQINTYGLDAYTKTPGYKIFLIGFSGSLAAACFGFLVYTWRLRYLLGSDYSGEGRQRRAHEGVMSKLRNVIAFCGCCFGLRLGFLALVSITDFGYHWASFVNTMDYFLWFLLVRCFPDYGLFFMMFYLTRMKQREVRVGRDESTKKRGVFAAHGPHAAQAHAYIHQHAKGRINDEALLA